MVAFLLIQPPSPPMLRSVPLAQKEKRLQTTDHGQLTEDYSLRTFGLPVFRSFGLFYILLQ